MLFGYIISWAGESYQGSSGRPICGNVHFFLGINRQLRYVAIKI